MGGFLGLLAGGYLGSLWGWRTAFVVAGIPGLVLAVLMLATIGDPRSKQQAGRQRSGASFLETLRMLLRTRRLLWRAIGLTCTSFFVYAPAAWLPPFFIRVHGMATARIGLFAGIAMGVGGVVGTLGSGIVCDLLRRRVRNVELKVLAIAATLSTLALLITLLSEGRTLALASMLLFDVCAFAFLGPIVKLIVNAATEQSRALAIAICISLSNIVNLGLVLPLVGALSDVLTPAYGPAAIRYALATSAVPAGMATLFAYWRTHHAMPTSPTVGGR